MPQTGTTPRVPRAFSEVTPEWLSAALAPTCPDVKVLSATVGKTMGFKPNKARVDLTYNTVGKEAGLPSSFVIKGTFNGTESRGAIIDFSNLAEVVSYRDIVPHIDMNVPRIYHLGIEHEPTESVVLLMEDLVVRKPTYFGHGLNSLTYGQAALFLDAIARYQAQSWNSPLFGEGQAWGPGTMTETNYQRIHKEYFELLPHSEHWTQSAQSPRGAAVPKRLRDPERAAAGWASLMQVLSSHARVIVHGDEHLGNYFIEGNGRPGFYDMLSRGERWPQHFAVFMIAALDTLDRRAWERPLLAYFLSRLAHHGADVPSFEEAWFAYRCSTICPFLIWFNNSSTWQPEAINTANAARAGMAVLDHDTFGLLGV